ncbi:MAG: hypothetical protein KAR03_00400 [Candidatus Thorarchaeota archaeon]|nr:hypothetical protein [Candidatus Thorarchaeota archaeon]
MSTRSLDHCTCGHNRKNHVEFDGGCDKCNCDVFHRGMREHASMVNEIVDK